MKRLNNYIKEAFKVTANTKINKISEYHYHPKTREELKELIQELIEERGNKADLNDIDTSEITDMSELFYGSNFNGDISCWNVGNVKYMQHMFRWSYFDGDISNWDVSNVMSMIYMFYESDFTGKNGDISQWDVSHLKYMEGMFKHSKFTEDISNWDVSKVITYKQAFTGCPIVRNKSKQPKFNI